MSEANPDDLVYMDPPYQGVSGGRDSRYLEGLSCEKFAAALQDMNRRRLSFIISYDGRTGEKVYGGVLPERLNLKHIEVKAGVSSQATLLGRTAETIESLYISPALVKRIGLSRINESQFVKYAQLLISS
ncbi:MAG: DNA adenine methylase [Deltaproteobacteria bacterium]|nr:DNA adenine methylase [Deltaproteobacteria bacterium]